MWETIGNTLASDNALLILITLVTLVLVISILAKLGLFRLNIKGINIGSDEDERAIIRQQIEWSQLFIQAFQKQPIFEGYDTYRTLYVLEKVFDEVLSWVVFNHISTSENYISIKQEKLWNLIQTLSIDPRFSSDEFKHLIYTNTSVIINRLVYIRRNYRK